MVERESGERLVTSARVTGFGGAGGLSTTGLPSALAVELWQLMAGRRWLDGDNSVAVLDPDTGTALANVSVAGSPELELAISTATLSARATWSVEERVVVLASAADVRSPVRSQSGGRDTTGVRETTVMLRDYIAWLDVLAGPQ